MNSVFSFSELGSIFEDARADFSANFRAARAVRGLPSGNYRLRIVSCVFSGTPGREHISFRLEVTSGPFCGRRLGRSDGETCPHCGKSLLATRGHQT